MSVNEVILTIFILSMSIVALAVAIYLIEADAQAKRSFQRWKSRRLFRKALKLDLNSLLDEFKKNGGNPVDSKDFSLDCYFRRDSDSGYLRSFYCDATHTIFLQNKGEIIAGIGFDLCGKTIIVKQIQGVKNQYDIFSAIKWERLLLRIVVLWAQVSGFHEVRVLPGRKNSWYTGSRAHSFHMHYDVTARRSSFKYDKDADVYKMALI